jgi:hypothetical protein
MWEFLYHLIICHFFKLSVCDGQMKMVLIPVNTNQLDFLPSLLPDQDESVSSNHSGCHPSEPT